MPRILRPIAESIVDSDSKIDNTRFSQPTRHHWRGASRDLLLLALSIISFKLTTPSYRGLSLHHKNSLSLRVFAFGEFAPVRCVITNKFALHSLTCNFVLS